jgi:hypothetical protein
MTGQRLIVTVVAIAAGHVGGMAESKAVTVRG